MAVIPTGPTWTQNVMPAYPYAQYSDDDNVRSFFDAYNVYAQAYLDYLTNLNLPIYTQPFISGPTLDWVATYLYGFPRPGLPAQGTPSIGPFNTYEFNTIVLNGYVPGKTTAVFATTDDIYKRCLTWLFYKGDGKVFNPNWLKRRIWRFLNGPNGTAPPVTNTYAISVAYTGFQAATITLATSTLSTIFQAAVEAGILELPFQVTWTVTLV